MSKLITIYPSPRTTGKYAKNVWDLQLFDNKVYIGQGNSSNYGIEQNAGPVPIYSLSSEGLLTNEFTVDDEQIDVFRVLNGELYIPGHDPTESWVLGNFYRKSIGNNWVKKRTIPNGVHVYDMEYFDGKLFAGLGVGGTASHKSRAVSFDMGETWVELETTNNNRTWNCFVFNNELYFSGYIYSTNVFPTQYLYKYLEGQSTLGQVPNPKHLIPLDYPQSGAKLKSGSTINFNGYLIYILGDTYNDHQIKHRKLCKTNDLSNYASLVNFPELNYIPTDLIVRGSTLYTVGHVQNGALYTNIIYKTTNLTTWEEVERYETNSIFAMSLEELNGSFYLGTGTYEYLDATKIPDTNGQIIKIGGMIMPKTYQNKQLAFNDIIKDSYNKINENSDAVNADLTDLYSQDANHFAGTANKHSTNVITNVSTVTGSDVTAALNTLKGQVESAVTGAANALIGVYSLTDTGVANAYVGSFAGQAIFTDMKVFLRPLNDNTGVSTFNYGASGVKGIRKYSNGVKVELSPRDIRVNEEAILEYDGTHWILLNGERNAEFPTKETTFASMKTIPPTAKGNLKSLIAKGQMAKTVPINNTLNNTTGWTGAAGNVTVSNNILKLTGTGSASSPNVRFDTAFKLGVGDTFFVRFRIRSNSSLNTKIGLRNLEGTTVLGVSGDLKIVSNPLINKWYTLYVKYTLPATSEGNLRLRFWSQYNTPEESLGNSIEIDGSIPNERITIIKMNGTEWENLSADQMNDRFPSHFNDTKNVEKTRFMSSNNFVRNGNGEKGVAYWRKVGSPIIVRNSLLGEPSFYITNIDGVNNYIEQRIKLPPNTNLPISFKMGRATNGEGTGSYGVVIEDITGVVVSELRQTSKTGTLVLRTGTFTTNSNSDYIIKILYGTANVARELAFSELVIGGLTYIPYIETPSVNPLPMRKVPAISDTYDAINRVHTQNVSSKIVLSEVNIESLSTSTTSIDLISITVMSNQFPASLSTIIEGRTLVEGYPEKGYADSVENENTHYTSSATNRIIIVVPKGTYATLAAAKTALAGTVVYYQLANPVITTFPSKAIQAGSVIHQEPYGDNFGYYNNGLAIEPGDPLIYELLEVLKWDIDNNSFVKIPRSSVTITNGVITAIAGAVNGEFYTYDFLTDPTLSLNAEMDVEYTVNTSGQIDLNTKTINNVDKKVDNLDATIKSLMARLEALEPV